MKQDLRDIQAEAEASDTTPKTIKLLAAVIVAFVDRLDGLIEVAERKRKEMT